MPISLKNKGGFYKFEDCECGEYTWLSYFTGFNKKLKFYKTKWCTNLKSCVFDNCWDIHSEEYKRTPDSEMSPELTIMA